MKSDKPGKQEYIIIVESGSGSGYSDRHSLNRIRISGISRLQEATIVIGYSIEKKKEREKEKRK